MRRTITAVLTLALVLCGCGSADRTLPGKATGDEAGRESGVSSPSPEPPASPESLPPAADGTDVSACFDGDCEISVSGPVDIPLDDSFRVTMCSVEPLDSDQVSIRCEYPSGGMLELSGTTGSTFSVNELTMRVVAIRGGTVILDFSPE